MCNFPKLTIKFDQIFYIFLIMTWLPSLFDKTLRGIHVVVISVTNKLTTEYSSIGVSTTHYFVRPSEMTFGL